MITKPGTPEWDAAWEGLRRIIIADDLGDGSDLAQRSGSGECWQYMGAGLSAGTHCFRHRDHPMTQCREYREVPVTDQSYAQPGFAEIFARDFFEATDPRGAASSKIEKRRAAVPPDNLLRTIAANVDNEKLTDEAFREFVRNSLPLAIS